MGIGRHEATVFDELRRGCDEAEGAERIVGVDSLTPVRCRSPTTSDIGIGKIGCAQFGSSVIDPVATS